MLYGYIKNNYDSKDLDAMCWTFNRYESDGTTKEYLGVEIEKNPNLKDVVILGGAVEFSQWLLKYKPEGDI